MSKDGHSRECQVKPVLRRHEKRMKAGGGGQKRSHTTRPARKRAGGAELREGFRTHQSPPRSMATKCARRFCGIIYIHANFCAGDTTTIPHQTDNRWRSVTAPVQRRTRRSALSPSDCVVRRARTVPSAARRAEGQAERGTGTVRRPSVRDAECHACHARAAIGQKKRKKRLHSLKGSRLAIAKKEPQSGGGAHSPPPSGALQSHGRAARRGAMRPARAVDAAAATPVALTPPTHSANNPSTPFAALRYDVPGTVCVTSSEPGEASRPGRRAKKSNECVNVLSHLTANRRRDP